MHPEVKVCERFVLHYALKYYDYLLSIEVTHPLVIL